MDVIPASHRDILESNAVAHIATIGPQGEPQNNPVWFDWDGQYIRFSQTETRQKYHNLQRDPRIAISIVDPNNHLRYIEVRGRMVNVEDDADLAFINRMAQKYINKEKYPWHRPEDHRIVVVVQPEHISKMGNAPQPADPARPRV